MNSLSDPVIGSGWQDLGVVFRGDRLAPWMHSHGYVPTACLLPDRIRVFAAFWDSARTGRIGYVDLDRDDPRDVLGHARDPVLDIGPPGAFDAHGVTPMSVVPDGDALRLYYAGWQRTEGARYLLFTGLAISHDGGTRFRRHADTPVLDRVPGHHLVRTGFIVREGTMWKAWLALSDGIASIAGKPTPTYRLGHCESADGITWPATAADCLAQGQDGIFGYGRSAIWREAGGYHGMISVRRRTGYRIDHASSPDGIAWTSPGQGGYALPPSAAGQAETMFPSVIDTGSARYVFYNGDGFGRDGIRCARWIGPAGRP
jgi:hypothetical protein